MRAASPLSCACSKCVNVISLGRAGECVPVLNGGQRRTHNEQLRRSRHVSWSFVAIGEA